jgi:predicted choloylglycine hydrolase
MNKLTLEGSYYDMGTHLGKMLRGKLVLPKASSEKLAWAANCEKVMEEYTPELLEELRGIAEVANFKQEDLNAILLYDCSYIKNYYLSPMQRCTVFTIPGKNVEGGEPVLARNYDWLTEVQEYFAVHWIKPTKKFRSILFTDHYVGGFGGVNEAGFACGCTVAAFYNGSIKPRMMLNMTIRWLLDNFTKVEDAVNFLEEIPLSEGNIYLLVDKTGASARVEASPDKIVTTTACDEFMIATNHFQTEEMKLLEAEITEENAHTTITRLQGITDWYNNHEKPISIESIKSILKDHEYGVCDHNGEAGTLWSWIAQLGTNKVEICEGKPCTGKYQRDSIF